jgi:hypothetical protein
MSNCAFSPYVGALANAQISIQPALGPAFDHANGLGLGPEFVEALLAEATLDGVKALAWFYEIIKANALYISVARRAFTSWGAFQLLDFEDALWLKPSGIICKTGPAYGREMIPAFYLYTFFKRSDWDVRTRAWIFDRTWWPQDCNDPFWTALCARDDVRALQARFEPHRTLVETRRSTRSSDTHSATAA